MKAVNHNRALAYLRAYNTKKVLITASSWVVVKSTQSRTIDRPSIACCARTRLGLVLITLPNIRLIRCKKLTWPRQKRTLRQADLPIAHLLIMSRT